MTFTLSRLIFLVGCGQLSVLVASALVPVQLDRRRSLADLPALVRQLFWIYGGYVVLSIASLGLICLFNADQLAEGSRLARSFCAYVAAFWSIRLGLQPFLQAREFLPTTWWLRAGYHLLTLLFLSFAVAMTYAALR